MLYDKIKKEGQRFYDQEVYLKPIPNPMSAAVKRAFGHPVPRPVMIGYRRVKLDWVKPA